MDAKKHSVQRYHRSGGRRPQSRNTSTRSQSRGPSDSLIVRSCNCPSPARFSIFLLESITHPSGYLPSCFPRGNRAAPDRPSARLPAHRVMSRASLPSQQSHSTTSHVVRGRERKRRDPCAWPCAWQKRLVLHDTPLARMHKTCIVRPRPSQPLRTSTPRGTERLNHVVPMLSGRASAVRHRNAAKLLASPILLAPRPALSLSAINYYLPAGRGYS